MTEAQELQKLLPQGRGAQRPRRTAEYVEGLSDARKQLREFFKLLPVAEVVKWQTRTFEGRVAQAVRVQVPPSAPNSSHSPDSRLTAGVERGEISYSSPSLFLRCLDTARTRNSSTAP